MVRSEVGGSRFSLGAAVGGGCCCKLRVIVRLRLSAVWFARSLLLLWFVFESCGSLCVAAFCIPAVERVKIDRHWQTSDQEVRRACTL